MRRRLLLGSSGRSAKWYDNYMTIEALEDGLVASFSAADTTATAPKIEYSLDGVIWVELNDSTPAISQGDVIAFRGNGADKALPSAGLGTFSISAKCNLIGNSLSLFYGDNASENTFMPKYGMRALFLDCTTIVEVSETFLPATSMGIRCYFQTFYGCTSLVKAPELPAMTISAHCYYQMFRGCTSLRKAPELPATTINEYCYYRMFYGCTSLVEPPIILPAMTLRNYCYYEMFRGCNAFTTAPVLPALSLITNCYYRMFYNCSKLNYIKALFTTYLSSSDGSTISYPYTHQWVYGVASSGTFVIHPDAYLNRGVSGHPNNWTIVQQEN